MTVPSPVPLLFCAQFYYVLQMGARTLSVYGLEVTEEGNIDHIAMHAAPSGLHACIDSASCEHRNSNSLTSRMLAHRIKGHTARGTRIYVYPRGDPHAIGKDRKTVPKYCQCVCIESNNKKLAVVFWANLFPKYPLKNIEQNTTTPVNSRRISSFLPVLWY